MYLSSILTIRASGFIVVCNKCISLKSAELCTRLGRVRDFYHFPHFRSFQLVHENPSCRAFQGLSGFSILMESSGCAGLPLTMTMLSLWPWHHSRLWIINRGLDPNADGLFVGKQGVISLSRQSDLMARHKYIKRGNCGDILWPEFRTISQSYCRNIWALWTQKSRKKLLFWLKSVESSALPFTRHEVCVCEGVRYDFWRLTLTPSVSPAWIHNVHTPRGSENTTSATLEPLKVRPFSCFCGVGQHRLFLLKFSNF